MKRSICSGCSLLCDDIMVKSDGIYIDEVFGACLKGKEKFDQITSQHRILSPMIRKGEKLLKASWDDALQEVADLIKKSKKPLIYGLSNSSCEAQLKGIELAKLINGFIDSNASICQGKVLDNAINSGITLTTITEIINKADLILLWGSNAAESIPRLLNKVLFSRGKFRMTGREIKTLIIIDPVKTASFNTMGVRDVALRITPGKDFELIKVLKEECCAADSIPSEGVAGLDKDDMKRLLQHLSGAEYGVIFVGQGILTPQKNSNLITELLELVQMINSKQKRGRISLAMMGGHFNMTGFDHVALSMYGKNGALQFKDNQISDTDDNIVSKIEKEDFDCSIFIGTDPISHFPMSLSSKIAKKPIILIDNHNSATLQLASIVLPTAITGIECSGLAYRLDHIPIELKKIINPPSKIPTDEEILNQIIQKLKSDGGN
ncbi:MAG: formylmethanofuran dehydrogenase subunit B [Promethearchaeota archaeon]|jgi:formylmethanofuran dehydrogenase subunit B